MLRPYCIILTVKSRGERSSPERTGTILIVDDDRVGRQLLGTLLGAEGYDLALAGSGAEALDCVAGLTPDLILLDVVMPDMDGFQVCQRLRADARLAEVPVIMVTALHDRDSRIQGIEVGADDFISKPYDRVELLTRVRAITRLNRNRRLLLDRLQAERDRTSAILEALGEAVVVTDVDGVIEYVNPAALDQTGFDRADLIGQNFRHWHTDRRLQAYYDRVDEGDKTLAWHGELISPRRDGSFYDAVLTLAPLRDSQARGRAVGFVGVQRDITPLKQAERMKDRFISNISHELRTPLSIITLLSGNLDTLYDRLEDEKRRGMIRDIRKQAQLLDDLIGDVLEIARIDSGHVPSVNRRLNLAACLREELTKQAPLAAGKALAISITGPDELPVRGDADQLRRVIRNLLNNAIKYNRQGGQVACECRAAADAADLGADWPGSDELGAGAWAAVKIADSGVGIGAKDLPRIFERFYRVKNRGNIPGTGLGLAISRELVRLHAGHIAVRSRRGQGSTFAFYLPLSGDDQNHHDH